MTNRLRHGATNGSTAPETNPSTEPAAERLQPEYIYGMHEPGGEHLMLESGRRGWVLALAEVGLDGRRGSADYRALADAGLGVIVRLNHGYGSTGTLPTPDKYAQFAAACATFVARSSGCHIWIVGNEPNHENERPNGQHIYPRDYVAAYSRCRAAIRALPGHENDQVLVAGPAPWNATTNYVGNERGDWVQYFVDVLALLPDDGCDGIALHTYTHHLNLDQIRGDFFHLTPGYRHRRNEFRTYQDFMLAIPDRFRHLPVFITETDPTTRGVGWEDGRNIGWVQAAYREIANWNADPGRQPIQALILYRWPRLSDQPEWSISNRPGIIEDFRAALRAEPAAAYRMRQPRTPAPPVVVEPGNMLPAHQRWVGTVTSPLGLNLRTGPSIEHEVIQILPNETSVVVLAEVGDWLFVTTLGKKGYVSRQFIIRQGLAPTDGGPTGLDTFLRLDSSLFAQVLIPPADQVIRINMATATWTEQTLATAWNQYGGLLNRLATILQVDVAVAAALLAIESGGFAFSADGRMMIRFEVHIFFDQWGRREPERFAQFFRFNPDRQWEGHQWRPDPSLDWRDFHGNQSAEWQAFGLAQALFNDHAAKLSISMGAPQIMGFNHQVIGYPTVEEMFNAFAASAHAQIIGLFDFVKNDPVRLQALRNRDFLTFARSYNGDGVATVYAGLLNSAVTTFERLRGAKSDDSDRLAFPGSQELPHVGGGKTLAALDKELYAAWRKHIVRGFEHNDEMFRRTLKAFIEPYYTTVWMYRTLFVVGIVSLIAAAVVSAWTREAIFGLLFGGLGVASFLSYFIGRPLRSLEENLKFITWLGVIYNSYWVRLVYALNLETIQKDIAEITDDFARQIERLIEKSASVKPRDDEDRPDSE